MKQQFGFILDTIKDIDDFQKFLAQTGLHIANSENVYYLKKIDLQRHLIDRGTLPKHFGYFDGIDFTRATGTLKLAEGFLSKIGSYLYDYKDLNQHVLQTIKLSQR
jgi:hypothetical protein